MRYQAKHSDMHGHYVHDTEAEYTDMLGHYVHDTESEYYGLCLNPSQKVSESYVEHMADMLNYADQHPPKPKKTLEDLVSLSNRELTELAGNLTNSCADFCDHPGAYYNVLRPELKELGYYIDVLSCRTHPTRFKLYNTNDDMLGEVSESPENTPARIYTILYLLAKELNHAD